MGVPSPPDTLIATSDEPVLVVEVTGADRARATQGNPPCVRFRVLESLRGDFVPGDEVHAIWESFEDPFYAGRAGLDALAAWMAAPLAMPAAGDTWIVMGARVMPAERAPTTVGPTPPRPPGSNDGQPVAVLPAIGALRIVAPSRLSATPEIRARIAALVGRR